MISKISFGDSGNWWDLMLTGDVVCLFTYAVSRKVVVVLTVEEAKCVFHTALTAELEAAKKDDIVINYTPIQRLSTGTNCVYLGTVEEETPFLEGSTVKIEDQHGLEARAEVVGAEDFELVLATDVELELEKTCKIKYNLAWLLETLLEWIDIIEPSASTSIAQGVLKPGRYFAKTDPTFEPKLSVSLNK